MKNVRPARYKEGNVLYNAFLKKNVEIDGVGRWNGLSYMYAMKGEGMRCGEEMFSPAISEIKLDPLAVLQSILDNAVHIGGTDYRIGENIINQIKEILCKS